MPYAIKKSGKKFQVYSKDSGRVVGTHPSRVDAYEQLKALYANVKDAGSRKKRGK